MMSKRGLTLIEVVLAMGLMALGILAGVELLGQLTLSQKQISAAETLQQRMIEARETIQEANWQEVMEIFEESELWQISSDLQARKKQSNIDSDIGMALEVEILDGHGNKSFGFEMIKLRDWEGQ